MIEQLLLCLKYECHYKPGDILLLGVSGGADSLALLHGLHSQNIPVIAAHLDHGLRSEASEDCQFVKQFSDKLGVPFVSKKSDVAKFAEAQKLSLEEAGRELRYAFLFEQAEKMNAAAVAVAHHADDQVETVLMHLLRGAGLEGLSGMNYSTITSWHDRIPLFRPLLNIWRVEIETYCASMDIHPRIDLSNLDVTFYRNRIRHELLPILEQYNPGIKVALWKTANTLFADREILEKHVSDQYQSVVDEVYQEGVLVFRRNTFLELHRGVQRRLIRLGIHRLRPELRDIGFDEVEKVIGYVATPPKSGEATLFRGLCLQVEGDRFMIFPADTVILDTENPQLANKEHLFLRIPGRLEISDRWEIRSEKLEGTKTVIQQVQDNQDRMAAYLDLGENPQPLLVKRRSPGEKFSPLGMAGKKVKLSDFLINEKMPKRLRDQWPLVYSGEALIWIPGYRISDQAQVTANTTDVVMLILQKKSN